MRILPAWRRLVRFWLPWILLGVCVGILIDHVFEDLLAAWEHVSGEQAQHADIHHAAAIPLGCYRQRMVEFADGVATYRNARFSDVASFRKAANALVPLIHNANDAYIALARERLPALLEAASGLGLSPPRERAICLLRSTEDFHWDEQRALLNSLLVGIVAAWHYEVGDQELEALRRQQVHEWGRYEQILRRYTREELLLPAEFTCEGER